MPLAKCVRCGLLGHTVCIRFPRRSYCVLTVTRWKRRTP